MYDTDIDDLWSALTDPDRLARWLGRFEGDLRLRGTFHARFVSTAEGPGRVAACEPPGHLLLTMEPETDEQTEIEAWLSGEGDRTRLVVEERGFTVEEAPDHAAGWRAHIEDLLAHLEGREPGSWLDRWRELVARYRPEPR